MKIRAFVEVVFEVNEIMSLRFDHDFISRGLRDRLLRHSRYRYEMPAMDWCISDVSLIMHVKEAADLTPTPIHALL